jgi:hypothetical protein
VGNANTLPSVVDILDIRVARGQDDSASDGERSSSAEDAPERFRPNLVTEAAVQKRTKAKRAEASTVAGGTRHRNKERKPASDSPRESDSSDSKHRKAKARKAKAPSVAR